jgi:hypothetical protein
MTVMKRLEKVRFITSEDDGTDLIIAFALEAGGPADIKSLILLRTPKYEPFLYEYERGVSVSLEGEDKEERVLLKTIRMSKGTVLIEDTTITYELDVPDVEEDEIQSIFSLPHEVSILRALEVEA